MLLGLLAALVLAAGLLPAAVVANPYPACEFRGWVYFDEIGGEKVPGGTIITARLVDPVDGPWWSTKTMPDGWYYLPIPLDDYKTPEKDGGYPGDIVYFTVTYDGVTARAQDGEWDGGPTTHLLVVPSLILGDANEDGIVNILDIITVKWMIVDPTGHPWTPGADANQDGTVDVLDITRIVQIILGID